MTILSLILAVYRRLNEVMQRRQSYAELRQLDAATLKDIGLRFENGRIVVPDDDLIDENKAALSERERCCRERAR